MELTEKTEVDGGEEQAGMYQTLAAAEQTEVGHANAVVDLETLNKQAASDCSAQGCSALHFEKLQMRKAKRSE